LSRIEVARKSYRGGGRRRWAKIRRRKEEWVSALLYTGWSSKLQPGK
jgi:hypothetical protein